MLCKVTHCAGRVSANTRPHQLRWVDWEMGTAIISCVECSQVAGLIQMVGRSSLEASSFRAAVLRFKIVAIAIVMCYRCVRKRKCMRARVYTEALEVPEVLMNKAWFE